MLLRALTQCLHRFVDSSQQGIWGKVAECGNSPLAAAGFAATDNSGVSAAACYEVMPKLFCTFKPAGRLEANSRECSDPVASVGFAAVTKHSMSAAAAPPTWSLHSLLMQLLPDKPAD